MSNMRTLCNRSNISLFRLAVASTIFVLLALAHGYGQAKDVSVEIQEHEERYLKLQSDFSMSQARIESSVSTFGAQQQSYLQLAYVSQTLMSMYREFDVLRSSITLANFVTEKIWVPTARRYVELQRDYMIKLALNNIGYIEKNMHRAGDQETTRLLLEARDLFRSSVELLGSLPLNTSKQ